MSQKAFFLLNSPNTSPNLCNRLHERPTTSIQHPRKAQQNRLRTDLGVHLLKVLVAKLVRAYQPGTGLVLHQLRPARMSVRPGLQRRAPWLLVCETRPRSGLPDPAGTTPRFAPEVSIQDDVRATELERIPERLLGTNLAHRRGHGLCDFARHGVPCHRVEGTHPTENTPRSIYYASMIEC